MKPQSRHATDKFKMYIVLFQIFHDSSSKSNILHYPISMKMP